MDWKSLYNNAFPASQPFKPYPYPKLDTPGGGEGSSSLPATLPNGPSQGGNYPQLGNPTGGSGSGAWPALAPPVAGEGSSYPELPRTGPAEGSTYPSMRWVDHVGDWSFRIEIEGVPVGHFTRVEGLTMNIEVIEYQHSDDLVPRKRMGRIKVDNVRLVKGYVVTPELFDWCEEAMKGDVSRKSLSVVLLADDHSTEMTRFNLFEAWPVKWSGFKLDGMGRGALVEEIELAVEEIRRG